ncbi:hypothetical protein EVAR_6143_1 [Eumeta japonica]|uniref:Uncharacterized protein n=1 Tax=Eumeta variegata TaxID=151549 RepID=A0A4C1THD0_EUMVA|nr:hypothetical protein EVAR_6143_1 [Eumeta japonica]
MATRAAKIRGGKVEIRKEHNKIQKKYPFLKVPVNFPETVERTPIDRSEQYDVETFKKIKEDGNASVNPPVSETFMGDGDNLTYGDHTRICPLYQNKGCFTPSKGIKNYKICVCAIHTVEVDLQKIKFGWSEALADKEYFFKVPRTLQEAEAAGWRRTDSPPGTLDDLRLYCAPGRLVCALYCPNSFIGGLQIALPVDEFESLAVKPEKNFVKWRAPALDGEPAKDYWTATQYYVFKDSLKVGAGPHRENGATLQDGGVWVTGPSKELITIPLSEKELNEHSPFKKQNCIPNMGIHYYYNMTSEMKCEDILPWFALVSNGELVGTGIQVFGKLPPSEPRDWFERPPARAAQITIPFAPPCLHEWAASYGVVSMHVYYVEAPWRIRCSPGDSAKPAPILDRLLMNGQRYVSQVMDELKNLFSG